jgi:hypothetical protein
VQDGLEIIRCEARHRVSVGATRIPDLNDEKKSDMDFIRNTMDDTHSVSASVASASTTQQRGIRLHIKKQLAKNLESNGFSDDSALVGIPGISYNHLYHIDSFAGVSVCISKEMDENRNQILLDPVKYNKIPMVWYLIKFPPRPGMSGVRLSVREIFINTEDL